MALNFAGFFNGKWGKPIPGEENPFPVFAGVDTHSFKWGEADFETYPNELSFVVNPFSTQLNKKFKVGDLIYFNGSVASDTGVESVPLNIELELYNPTRTTKSFEFDFDIVQTDNTFEPEENADFVFPLSTVSDGSFKYKGKDYTIRLLGFSQDKGKTFTEEFRVLEDATTTAGLYAKIEVDKGIGTSKNNNLKGSSKDDRLDGKGGNDTLTGKGGNDILIGGAGKDKLNGGAGDDNLNSGAGNDILTGNGGADSFIYDTGRNFRKQDVGVDTIADFVVGEDTIVLSRTTFTKIESLAGSLLEDFAVVDSQNAAKTSDALIVYDETNGNLYYNQNGSNNGFGSGGLFARLKGNPELQATDFFIDN